MITFDLFEKIYAAIPGEPEFEFIFRGSPYEYMVIKYEDCASFQRCGLEDGSKEVYYPDLETLCNAISVDGICLKSDWSKIKSLVVNSAWNMQLESDVEDIVNHYSIV